MGKYTAGKWHVEEKEYHELGDFRGIFDSDGFEIINQHGVLDKDNANLIARAPELLEACKEALELIYWQKENKQRYDAEVEIKLEKVIEKAEGRS